MAEIVEEIVWLVSHVLVALAFILVLLVWEAWKSRKR